MFGYKLDVMFYTKPSVSMLWRKALSFVWKIICSDCYVELLNQKTEEIERMMNEKKTLIADILQIPLHDYDTVTEVCLHYLSLSHSWSGVGGWITTSILFWKLHRHLGSWVIW